MRPQIQGIVESVLYTDDLAGTAAFYEEVLGLVPIASHDGMRVFQAGTAQNLLLDYANRHGSIPPTTSSSSRPRASGQTSSASD